ncbi:4'-phosphopantetheinyl transferase superfamily protein [Mycoplasmopsis adleri]|uniref:4'-phosphopantetheinyl transferase superfamily protein n=1 Tax=Mycoplasmopsis adleri TaxID=51362 RepID=UPI00387382D0
MLGVDLAKINRFDNVSDDFIERFLSPAEIIEFNKIKDNSILRSKYAATHWAIKEALLKADGKLNKFKEISITKIDGKYHFLDFEISTSNEDDMVIAIVYKN